MQYFYIVVYTIVGDDMTMCKIGLNPHQLIEWGRREATRHPERTYELFRQPITRTGTLSFYKQLPPFESKDSFDLGESDTCQGSDFDSNSETGIGSRSKTVLRTTKYSNTELNKVLRTLSKAQCDAVDKMFDNNIKVLCDSIYIGTVDPNNQILKLFEEYGVKLVKALKYHKNLL